MASYGIPYMGSKDKLMYKLGAIFPKADYFYDLFGGGFSVSHFMVLHRSAYYKKFFYNEIKSDIVQLVRDAIQGKYNYNVFKPKWISRDEFNANKSTCAYTRLIWSFGNNQKYYLFGEHVELQKRSLHNAVVFNEFDDFAIRALNIRLFPEHLSIRGRRLLCRNIVAKRAGELQQLQQLERLERLQQLQQLEQLELSSMSYDQVKVLPNSVVYCDPPYKGTAGYLLEFDHNKFWTWVMDQKEPVFVSEYQAPKGVHTVAAFRHKKSLASTTPVDSVEKLFGNDAAKKLINP